MKPSLIISDMSRFLFQLWFVSSHIRCQKAQVRKLKLSKHRGRHCGVWLLHCLNQFTELISLSPSVSPSVQQDSPRKPATFFPDLAMFISRTKSACVVKPSRELFWARSSTSSFRMDEFSWEQTAQTFRGELQFPAGLTRRLHVDYSVIITDWRDKNTTSRSKF